ncbi:MAG: glycosyltransferase [Pseudomonadota bacterium]
MQNQLHVVANAAVTSGGEGLAALRYAESIAQSGCMVTFLSKHLPSAHISEPVGDGILHKEVVPTHDNLLHELWGQYRHIQSLCERKKFDLIHLHGMWSPFLAVIALVAGRKKIPFVISPHGCLEPWALGYKRQKKWLALKCYQGKILRSASLFVATANQELESIRLLGLRQPVAVIPNGVDFVFSPSRDENKSVKTILFLSRVHPKKGLLDLVEAWAKVRQPGWRIVIAGGDEDDYRAKVEALIRARELQSDFEFIGFVEGASKQVCFDKADIFILPTYSENFGLVVAEALSNEIPVVTTTGAPWHDLVEYRCGWWVQPGVDGVAAALAEAMDLDPAELRAMGQRGRKLVENKYAWSSIGASALAVSTWLLDRSVPRPIEVME